MNFRKQPSRTIRLLGIVLMFLYLVFLPEKVRLGAAAARNVGNISDGSAADPKSNSQPSINEFKFENGLKVLLEEQHARPLISIGVWYRVGSKDDPNGLEGISRLTQELTYRGSQRLPGLQGLKILEEAGGQWASYTLKDQSCFLATVPKSSIGEMLKLEAARMSMDTFSSEDVRKEKDILQDRVLGLKDDPKQVLDFEVSMTAFRSNPYRWPTEGVNDSIQRITPEQVWQHYSRYYIPNNAILVVVGDFETKQLLGEIEKSFGGITRKNDPPQIDRQEPPQLGERRVKVNRQGSIPYLEIAYPAPHILNDDFFALLLIDVILNGTDGLRFPIPDRSRAPIEDSWLHKGLVEKKLSTQVSTELVPTQGTYLYKVTLSLTDRFQYQAAEEAFSELMENLRNFQLSEEQMQKVRFQVLNAEILDQRDCANRAFKLGYLESIATYKLLGEFETKINQVTSQDLKRVASKYLSDEFRTVGWCIPLEKKSVIQIERLQGANAAPRRVPEPVADSRTGTHSSSRVESVSLCLKPAPHIVCSRQEGSESHTLSGMFALKGPAIIAQGKRVSATAWAKSTIDMGLLPHPRALKAAEKASKHGGMGRREWKTNKNSSVRLDPPTGVRKTGYPAAWRLTSHLLDSFRFWKPLALQASPLLDAPPLEQAGSSAGIADSAISSWPFKMERKLSANGATLIVLENRAAPSVTLSAVIRAGGARDLENREGTALFVARMLGRGTKSRSAAKIWKALEKLQARLDIETGYLASVMILEGPSGKLPELLQLLSDIVESSAFTQFEMESVRVELLAGLREAETQNQQILHRLLREKIYPSGHPYRRPVQGTFTSIERINLTDLDSFYKKNYRPELFSLIIAGDVQASSSLDAAEKLFGTWKVSGRGENISLPEISSAVDSSSQVLTYPEKAVCSVGFGVPGVDARHPDFLAMSLANQVFGKGRSSRLAQRIRNEDGLTAAVESGFIGQAGEGPMAIQVTMSPLKMDALVSAVRSEVERVQKDGINDSEFESAKKAMINAYWVRLSSNRGLAEAITFSEINQLGPDYVSRYPDLIAGIRKDQVSECTRKYLDFELGPKVIVGPYEMR